MNNKSIPEWFKLADECTAATMKRISESIKELSLPLQVRYMPVQAHWFILDSLLLANRANCEGMHANALSLTRQCLEAISIVELGLAPHVGAAEMLSQWERDKITSGALRRWLELNVWPAYGSGLWAEPWSEFMRQLASAIQPYAHYTSRLAAWQAHLIGQHDLAEPNTMVVRFAARAYDPQKATRITLFHTILTYTLARIWLVSRGQDDREFAELIKRLGKALGRSKYLDGHQTNWEQQFWAMVWSTDGGTILE